MHLVLSALGVTAFVAVIFPVPYLMIKLADKTLFREL